MTVPFNYEINVSTQPEKNAAYGRHYCRIELGDLTTEAAISRFKKLNEKLGDEFRLTLSVVECKSEDIAGYCYTANGEEWTWNGLDTLEDECVRDEEDDYE